MRVGRDGVVRVLSGVAVVAALLAGPVGARAAERQLSPAGISLRESRSSDVHVLAFDRPAVRAAARSAGDASIALTLPIEDGAQVQLQPMPVVNARTRFVVGQAGGADRALASFDPGAVTMLRGPARLPTGEVGSAFIAFDAQRITGRVTFGARRYELTTAAGGLRADELLLRPVRADLDRLAPDVPLCAADTASSSLPELERGAIAPQRGLRRIQLAVDTDYELFERFGNLADEAFYITALYGVVSDIYSRDLRAHMELTYVRLWDTPADLFNDADPLYSFAGWWDDNMSVVTRDAAQFLTGRRDLPYGGVAWVNGMCNDFQYSVAGLISGVFDPSLNSGPLQWDIIVSAHELGHTCGTAHTHDYGLDDCYPLPGTPSRGTIMGYCHLQNGGTSNTDLRFDAYVQDLLRANLASLFCIDADCNANNVDDALDLAGGTSADVDGSGVPDECEDCDGDGTLDSAAILTGAADLDGDGVPDVCADDCNANGLPDDYETEQQLSADENHNRIPDGCEADCDGDGVADHVQIRANMNVDVDRDGVLDVCADCDGDGASDLAELAGAFDLWVVGAGNKAYAYHARTGALRVATSGGTISEAQDVIISPAGTVLVASGANWRVIEFDRMSGAFIRNFVATGAGGMRYPAGLAFGPDGNLYVASRDTDAIFRYDGASGAYLNQFVLPNAGGLDNPYGITFGPNGNLFVSSSATHQVLEYDGATGAFVRAFVAAGSGGLFAPRALVFKHDGNLLVASSGTGRVLEYARDTGAFVGIFNRDFATVGTDLDAWGLAIGPHGNVYVGRHVDEYRVMELEATSGTYLQSFVRGPTSGLNAPTGIRFAPGFAADCNRNSSPDSCELLAGEADADSNGVLDVCQTDCDANGVYDWLEIIPRGRRLDCNFNGVLDDCEIASGHPAAGACVACGSAGDFDSDGDYDLLDAYYFAQCVGADVTARSECVCANLAGGDSIVDGFDWAALESLLSGPQ